MDVVINSNCWQSYNDINKEKLLFHELGHAVLNRPHNDYKLPDGDFKSMMCSTPLNQTCGGAKEPGRISE
jgi:predicted SprT family Zn-dependent metalloprotease